MHVQDGSFNFSADNMDLKCLLELRAEAEFYGLTGLLEHIDRYPVCPIVLPREISVPSTL